MEPEKSIIKEFLDGGWVIPLIGAAAMLARLLSAQKKVGILEYAKKITAAAISSSIAWFILEQTDISSLYKAICYGIIGVISPEIINGIIKLGKRFQEHPEKYIKK
mgnify:CR=1 FL=1|jgi:hypothetical protein